MSIETVLQQMIIIFILIITGVFLYRKSMLSDNSSKQISGIIINLCNPALLISSALSSGPKASGRELLTGFFIVLLAYLLLFVCSYLIPYILRIPEKEHYAYRLITVYGNVGFIGIPLALAVLGSESLIYVSLNNLVFNILIYTHCISTIKNAVNDRTDGQQTSHTAKFLNAGTVSAILTLVLYLSNIRVPVLLADTLDYIGRSTTFLSMLVLGVSVAQMPFREIFTHGKLYLFALIRMAVLPVACTFLFRLFTDNSLIVNTVVLMLAVPAANMPLIFAKRYELDCEILSKGIILSTILSLITIPIVSLFV